MSGSLFAYPHPMPAVAADVAVFTVHRDRLQVLLITRREQPYAGRWALPGGFVDVGAGYGPGHQGESLDAAAARELKEETGLDVGRDELNLDPVQAFGDPDRDPRGRVISAVYWTLIRPGSVRRVRAGDDAAEARWVDARRAARRGVDGSPLAFDHDRVVAAALLRADERLVREPRLARAALPRGFTSGELREVFEAVERAATGSTSFDTRFRRMLADGLVSPVPDTRPRRYRFSRRSPR